MDTVKLENFHYHIAADLENPSPMQITDFMRGTAKLGAFDNPETCARFFLNKMIDDNGDERLRLALHQPHSAVKVDSIQKLGSSTLVRFNQIFMGVPVFGAEALVELDERSALISVRWNLGSVDLEISLDPSLSHIAAAEQLARAVNEDLDVKGLNTFELQLFKGHDHAWRLVWHFFDVPEFPYVPDDSDPGEPRTGLPSSDFLVDAHNGDVIFAYGKALSASSHAQLTGQCEDGLPRTITGSLNEKLYRFHDIVRSVRTHDTKFSPAGRVVGPLVTSPSNQLHDAYKSAVSAHYNATLVADFIGGMGLSKCCPTSWFAL